jgi:hypothetical protein
MIPHSGWIRCDSTRTSSPYEKHLRRVMVTSGSNMPDVLSPKLSFPRPQH